MQTKLPVTGWSQICSKDRLRLRSRLYHRILVTYVPDIMIEFYTYRWPLAPNASPTSQLVKQLHLLPTTNRNRKRRRTRVRAKF